MSDVRNKFRPSSNNEILLENGGPYRSISIYANNSIKLLFSRGKHRKFPHLSQCSHVELEPQRTTKVQWDVQNKFRIAKLFCACARDPKYKLFGRYFFNLNTAFENNKRFAAGA